MVRLVIGALSLLACTGCTLQYKATFPVGQDGAAQTLEILPIVQQDALAIQVRDQNSVAAGVPFGLVGVLVTSGIDATVNNAQTKRAARHAETLDAASRSIDLFDEFAATIPEISEGPSWRVTAVGGVSSGEDLQDRLNTIFEGTDVSTVVVYTGRYELTPSLDQLAVRAEQSVFYRNGPTWGTAKNPQRRASLRRLFHYLSPRRPLMYRELGAGEVEALAAQIRDDYAEELDNATEPRRREALKRKMEREIEDLESTGRVTDVIALAENWTPETVDRYLKVAKSHLRLMIEHDLNDVEPEKVPVRGVPEYRAVTAQGVEVRISGRQITSLDGQVLLRTFAGEIYSLPASSVLE